MNLSEMEDWDFSKAWVEMSLEEKAALPPEDRKFYVQRYRELTSYMEDSARRFKKSNGEPPVDDPGLVQNPQFVAGAEFISDITPPQWLIDGIIQRSFLYGLTAQTNHGKTAVAALIAICVAMQRDFANQPCEQGHVLYLAGENPEDFKHRLRATAQVAGLKPAALENITVMPVAGRLSGFVEQILKFAKDTPLALIIVDTAAAYFSYMDENGNVDSRMHAQDMRMLIQASGKPAILALCHPTKAATKEDLIPRGGGAFLNEIDCNLTLWKEGEIMELHHGKLRGPTFQPMLLKITKVVLTGVVDSKGRPVDTVVAEPITDSAAALEQQKHFDDSSSVLRAIDALTKPSVSAIANFCNWSYKDGRPDKSKVQRLLKVLVSEKFVVYKLGSPKLTTKGQQEIA